MTFLEPGFERWHDFFLLAGTAGATLLGLLFVAVSLKTDIIMRGSQRHLRAQAMSAFESLMFVMILSLAVLVPVARMRLTGAMLITLGMVGLVRAVAAARGDASPAAASLRRRLILPVLAYVFIAWSGIEAIASVRGASFQLFAATLWLLITATRGAWQLLVEVGETK